MDATLSAGVAAPPLVAGSGRRPAGPAEAAGARQYIRGSSLLLFGRFISVVLNFGVQVLAVRYLSKTDYGAFAYGLGVASAAANIVLLGLGKGIPRLVPIYEERNDHERTFGSIVLAVSTIAGLGLLLVALLHAFQGLVGREANLEPAVLSLLLVLIALGPLDALDNLLQQLAAVFCPPRAIFLRRQVLGPGLKLAAVALVTLAGRDVYWLAYGYLAGSAIGVSLYITMLLRVWRRQGLLQHLRPGRFRLPARELFGFSVPLLSTDLTVALRGSLVVVLLEFFRTTADVAEFRAVLPVAALNMVVFQAFGFLFVPLASRMYARNDREGMDNLYWQTAIWITVLTFPVFIATFLLAPTLTVLLFGERYAGAGVVLAILAVGHYVNAATGFNAATLRAYGKIRIIVASDALTALLAIVLGVTLIRRYGALGGAVATTATLILQNVFSHVGLWRARTGIRLLAWPFARLYLQVTVVTSAALAVTTVLRANGYATALVAAVACLLVVRMSRHSVDPKATFPELLRIPLLRRLLA